LTAYSSLSAFLRGLESEGELHRVACRVSARHEISEIVSRTTLREGPALLFEQVDEYAFPVAANILGTARRCELALGRAPAQIGEELARAAEQLQPPSPPALWRSRSVLQRMLNARVKRVLRAPCQQVTDEPDLSRLPILTCWPGDGGPFVTWPVVVTQHPVTGGRNVGTYRMHVYDERTTGMHMQIQKGAGFHYHEAEALGQPLPACVILGGDPILMLASVAPLPENVDELAFAAFLRGRPLEVARARTVPIAVPASADFVLEGLIPPGERRCEGPFGDHFGHYSHPGPHPVFHLSAITRRRDAVFPVSVVGQPPQEDRSIGDALQEMMIPLARLMHPEVRDLWAFFEAGFHNLLAVSVKERYLKESLKAAFGLLGTGQVSLSKVVVTVGPEVNARDPEAVFRALGANFVPEEDFILLPGTSMDTLDFTSFRLNLGSKMILDATPKAHRAPRPPLPPGEIPDLRPLHPDILEQTLFASSLLVVRVRGASSALVEGASPGRPVLERILSREAASAMPVLSRVPLCAVVSEDVRLQDRTHMLWGLFSRFDAARDVIFSESRLIGAAPVHRGTLGIDATWKPGYPGTVHPSDETRRQVDARWREYGLDRMG
jgi:4-hydroxybenzoate decarboxylase subunit C